jgi:hypothetical protein
MKKGPFEETARTIKYQNSWIRVEEASVIRPNGEKGIFGLVHMKPGSTVLALDARERVLLIREQKIPASLTAMLFNDTRGFRDLHRNERRGFD